MLVTKPLCETIDFHSIFPTKEVNGDQKLFTYPFVLFNNNNNFKQRFGTTLG